MIRHCCHADSRYQYNGQYEDTSTTICMNWAAVQYCSLLEGRSIEVYTLDTIIVLYYMYIYIRPYYTQYSQSRSLYTTDTTMYMQKYTISNKHTHHTQKYIRTGIVGSIPSYLNSACLHMFVLYTINSILIQRCNSNLASYVLIATYCT